MTSRHADMTLLSHPPCARMQVFDRFGSCSKRLRGDAKALRPSDCAGNAGQQHGEARVSSVQPFPAA